MDLDFFYWSLTFFLGTFGRVQALKSIFNQGRTPDKLRTDKGVEYKNAMVQKLMDEEGIDHFFTNNESKAIFGERAIKNIKSRISRYRSHYQTNKWIGVLSSITASYNNTHHCSIKISPKTVKKKNEVEFWKLQYQDKEPAGGPATTYKFKARDSVRISHLQRPFQREYDERWTYENFVVSSREMNQGLPYYTLKDVEGER